MNTSKGNSSHVISLSKEQIREIAASLGIKDLRRIPENIVFSAVDPTQFDVSRAGGSLSATQAFVR